MAEKFIQTNALFALLELEPYVLIASLVASVWLFYRFFLRSVSEERHANIRNHYRGIIKHFVIFSVLFVILFLLRELEITVPGLRRLNPYIGVLTFLWGNIVFVRCLRLFVLQYLFLTSMRAGVPLLLVNIFTLLLSVILLIWGLSQIFGIQLTPLLATSAAFSIILGLALQDTLGNLFAGISLQVDKSFELGDWLEVINGPTKAVGQVKELSWRSTLLVGFSDELITIPNRIMAQAQISNFSPDQPIMRSQFFRFPYGSNVDQIKDLMERAVTEISEVKALPRPFAYVADTNESFISIKMLYFIDSYGMQFVIGDKVFNKILDVLKKHNIETARNVLEVRNEGRRHES